MKTYLAEAIGTFCLVFAGTGAIVVNEISGGAVTHVGVSLTFGLVVAAMIYTLGDVSGAHLNPAVSLGFWRAGQLPASRLAAYLLSQTAGAVLASLAVLLIFGDHAKLGATLPAGSPLQSLVLEGVLTFILMFVILGSTSGDTATRAFAGLAIGAVVALEALFAGPICGASMNPARSFGPAVVSGCYESLWVYLVAPVVGAQLAVFGCRAIKPPGCCDQHPGACAV